MNNTIKMTLAILVLGMVADSSAYFKITNKTLVPAQIFITGWGYKWTVMDSNGNLAYDKDGKIDDKEGKYRTIQPNQTITYDWDETDPRANVCLKALMIKFSGQTSFVAVAQKDNFAKGCQNQIISFAQEAGKTVATFTYEKKEDKKPRNPTDINLWPN